MTIYRACGSTLQPSGLHQTSAMFVQSTTWQPGNDCDCRLCSHGVKPL